MVLPPQRLSPSRLPLPRHLFPFKGSSSFPFSHHHPPLCLSHFPFFFFSSHSSSHLMHRSGARFTHVWTRLLQAFVPEASFYFFSNSIYSLKKKKMNICTYTTTILLCTCSFHSSFYKGFLFFLVFYNIQGFPSSVTADYVPFQIWDSLQVTI